MSPSEIESVLASCPGVSEVAAIGLPHPDWGETICAVVVIKERVPVPSLDDLRRHAALRLAPTKHPRHVVAVESLPRTAATGQVQRPRRVQQVLSALDLGWRGRGLGGIGQRVPHLAEHDVRLDRRVFLRGLVQ